MESDKTVRVTSPLCALALLLASCGGAKSEKGLPPDAGGVEVGGADGGASEVASIGGGSPSPFIQILSQLEDGTTSAGQGPFQITFYSFGRPLDESTTSHLSSRLELRTWPEGEAIALTTQLDPKSNSTMAVVLVAPTSALTDRWFSLGFGPREDGLQTNQSFGGGTWGVRLRPGTHPAVRLIQLCGADIPGMKLLVSFSEDVTFGQGAGVLSVEQNGNAVSCPVYDTMPGAIYEFCADLKPGPLTVTIGAGLAQGASGSAVTSATWSIDSTALPITNSGCRGYFVPL